MSLKLSVNLNSLRLVRDEIVATVGRAGGDFEAWLADRAAVNFMENCHTELAQVAGTMRLIEFPAAAMLADEMVIAVKGLQVGELPVDEALMNAMSHAFFVFPHYLEYVASQQYALPVLLLPYINELRAARKVAFVAESQFYTADVTWRGTPPGKAEATDEGIKAACRRFRHMYQVGLLALLTGSKKVAPNIRLIHRALERVAGVVGPNQNKGLWQLSTAVAESMVKQGLEVNPTRVRLLAAVEKQLRELAMKGQSAFAIAPPDTLLKELVFLLMLSSYREGYTGEVTAAISIPMLTPNDAGIRAERASMHGPNYDTIESVAKVLREELRGAEDILEIGSQNGAIATEEIDTLIGILSRVRDTLSLLNLGGPGKTLGEQLEKIRLWKNSGTSLSGKDFMGVADALLYVESGLAALKNREISLADLEQASVLTRQKIIASSQLAEAERVVIHEAQAGIAMAKRAITSYVDSNFDAAHIANVAVTLHTVWGGLHVLDLKRAAAVLKSSIDFISSHMKQGAQGGAQRHQLLETLADAMISLEYYLDEVETSTDVNEDILEVAEESLAALGFAVAS